MSIFSMLDLCYQLINNENSNQIITTIYTYFIKGFYQTNSTCCNHELGLGLVLLNHQLQVHSY